MEELTPAMKQFVKIKKDYPHSILLFRMGDFYETFYEDAKVVSEVLNITLTKRGAKSKIPLAGIPFHSLNTYLKKLIVAGKTVTIIEQMEDPKLAKGRLVKREVVRTVTPGTIIEDDFLDSKTNNYLLSLFKDEKIGVSFLDISTGEFFVFNTDVDNLITDLTKINPAEILVPDSFDSKLQETISRVLNTTITEQPFIYFSKDFGEEKIKDVFQILSLKSFGIDNCPEIIGATGALLQYVEYTQKAKLKNAQKIHFFDKEKYLSLDAHTIKNLEILHNSEGQNKNTLFSVLDFTKTPMGTRFLKKNIVLPLKDKDEINKRLNFVEKIKKQYLSAELAELLSQVFDLERLNSKIIYGNANPRDLVSLKQSLKNSVPLMDFIKQQNLDEFYFEMNDSFLSLISLIDSAILDDPSFNYKEGGFIKKGFSKDLDELLEIKTNVKDILLQIESSEREKTGLKSIRIGYNKIFGFYFEIPKSQINNLPGYFVRKQTLVNTERLITEELKNVENSFLGSEEKSKALELELFLNLVEQIKTKTKEIYALAEKIASLDFYNSLAICAIKNKYCKPNLNTNGNLHIKNGRHPIIETIEAERFVPNDLFMSQEQSTIILTGPNMSGKSTFLRQNALIILMAQIGSFVPCDEADICIIDRIYTRIGASDNLALGLSTFMVEMIETANILNNATQNSFVVLDEIGRGTSTYDGMSIAWAVLEYICTKIKAKTLFATHYHQLTQLENNYSGVKNYHISAKEIEGTLVFLRKVESGGVDKSYGIAVANLAGLPHSVIERAKEIEASLDKKSIDSEPLQKPTPKEIPKNKLESVQITQRKLL